MTAAFVLDASVTAGWLLPDGHSPASEHAYARLRRGAVDAHAPDLWLWECGNTIANGVRRARVDPVWSVLDAIRTRVELFSPDAGQVRACLLLGIDHALSIHDAAYLWLAEWLGLPLLTHDATLARAATRRAVKVLRVEDLQ